MKASVTATEMLKLVTCVRSSLQAMNSRMSGWSTRRMPMLAPRRVPPRLTPSVEASYSFMNDTGPQATPILERTPSFLGRKRENEKPVPPPDRRTSGMGLRSSVPLRVAAVMLARPSRCEHAQSACNSGKLTARETRNAEGQGRPVGSSGQHARPAPRAQRFQQFTSQTCSRNREPARAMPLGFRHVVFPCEADPLPQRVVHPARHPRRHAHEQRPRRHPGSLRHHGARRYDAPRAYVDVVHENAAHADQAVVLDRATVEDGTVAHADPGPDPCGPSFVHMHDRPVLEVGGSSLPPTGPRPATAPTRRQAHRSSARDSTAGSWPCPSPGR